MGKHFFNWGLGSYAKKLHKKFCVIRNNFSQNQRILFAPRLGVVVFSKVTPSHVEEVDKFVKKSKNGQKCKIWFPQTSECVAKSWIDVLKKMVCYKSSFLLAQFISSPKWETSGIHCFNQDLFQDLLGKNMYLKSTFFCRRYFIHNQRCMDTN